MITAEQFFENSRIEPKNDTVNTFLFLSSPESVARMVIASELNMPALSGVVKELEAKFGDCKDAPLNLNGEHRNMVHRQNVGRMIRVIMREVGYYPIDGGLSERARIPSLVKSKYFGTSAVYKYFDDKDKNYKVKFSLEKVEK